MKIGLRIKVLIILSLLCVAAVALYSVMAYSIFREEKLALLYEVNHSLAVTQAAQLESAAVQLGEQVRFYALGRIPDAGQGMRLSPDQLKKSHVKGLKIYKRRGRGFYQLDVPTGFPKQDLWIHDHQTFLEQAEKSGYALASLRPPKGNSWDLLLAVPIRFRSMGRQSRFFAVAKLEGSFFFEPLQRSSLFKTYLMSLSGKLLVQLENGKVLPLQDDKFAHPLLTTIIAQKEGNSSGLKQFQSEGRNWYGAYAPVGISQLYLISQVEDTFVTEALTQLIHRSARFALLVLAATLIASVIFSDQLTRNLRLLASYAKRIGAGELGAEIKLQSGDEVGELAKSMNSMSVELKASRDRLRNHAEELEHKVAERTKELREKNIAIRKAQEKQLTMSKLAAAGEIAGRTAHEVLNPLTGIMSQSERMSKELSSGKGNGYSTQLRAILNAWRDDLSKDGVKGLMKSLKSPSKVLPEKSLIEEDLENLEKITEAWEQETEPIGKIFKTIHDRSRRINRIVDQMRKLIRSSSVRTNVSCGAAIQEAIETVADYVVDNKKITIEPQLNAQPDLVHMNKDEFVQIVANFIRNAAQAIESNPKQTEPGKIDVITRREDKKIIVEVIDNGAGIKKSQQKYLFGEGFTTKSADEGTGLGLAICRRYARAFGGEAEFGFSDPGGKGTCFRVWLPEAKAVPLKKAA